jgi:hypothetical protein
VSVRPALAIALLLLAIALPVSADEAYPDGGTVTFQELTEHTSAYYGKIMHVRGVLNQCTYSDCKLCPDWNHFDQCVSVSGWALEDEARLYRELYRFSEAVFTVSVYDNIFLKPREPDASEIDCFSPARLCLSKIGLINAEKLIERRPAPLVDVMSEKIEPSDDASLRSAFKDYLTNTEPDSARLFLIGAENGFLCTAKESSLDAKATLVWPRKAADLLASPANPYVCFEAERQGKDRSWEFSGLVSVSDGIFNGIK